MSLDRKIWDNYMKNRKSLGREDCPLCHDEEYIIKSFKYWNIFKNKFPYAGITKHLLLVPKRHIEHTKHLSKNELLELPKVETYIEQYFNGENYFSFIRQTNGGKSIKHIHYHYIPGVLHSDSLEEAIKKSNKL